MKRYKRKGTIPKFPNFSKLTKENRFAINKFTNKFEPYSDFNFTSLLIWNIDNSTEVSLLNKNLVIRMDDYITSKPCYSILGKKKIDGTLEKLLSLDYPLKFVPEVVIQGISKPENFKITEDDDQYDYVYDVEMQSVMPGSIFKIKRNKLSKFKRIYEDRTLVRNLDFDNPSDEQAVLTLFTRWAKDKNSSPEDTKNELKALSRVFKYSEALNLQGIKIYIDNELVSFSIYEVLPKKFCISHFQKSNLSFEHLDVFTTQVVANRLLNYGCKYFNWEQDLGLEGLRSLKKSYHPDYYLKKYLVSLR